MDINVLHQILDIAFQKQVSDLHFEVDNPPFFRAQGPADPGQDAQPDCG